LRTGQAKYHIIDTFLEEFHLQMEILYRRAPILNCFSSRSQCELYDLYFSCSYTMISVSAPKFLRFCR